MTRAGRDGQQALDALAPLRRRAGGGRVDARVDGLEVCRRLRAAGDRTRCSSDRARCVTDRVRGLDAGATTTWSSHSRSRNCWLACARCCAAAAGTARVSCCACRRRAESARAHGPPCTARDRAHAHGVPAAGAPDAPSTPGADALADLRARVGLRLRRVLERAGGVRGYCAASSRRAVSRGCCRRCAASATSCASVSFRRRIAFTAAAAVAIAVAIGSVVAYVVVRDTLLRPDRHVAARGRGWIDDDARVTRRRLGAGSSRSRDPWCSGSSSRATTAAASAEAPERLGDRGGRGVSLKASATRSSATDGRRRARARLHDGRSRHGLASQTARPLTEVDDALGNLRLGSRDRGAGRGRAGRVLGRLATRHAVRPVTELSEAAEHVARTRDLSRRIEAKRRRRAGAAGDVVQHDARRRSTTRSERQRQLVADASHELRTR